MSKRSYGSGRLYVRACQRRQRGLVWHLVGGRNARQAQARTEAQVQHVRRADARAGERELRRRMETERVIASPQQRTVGQAGRAYIDHLEHVMERKRTTLADYRGYLRNQLGPFLGEQSLEKIVQNHLNFLRGIFVLSVKRGWALNPRRWRRPRSAALVGVGIHVIGMVPVA